MLDIKEILEETLKVIDKPEKWIKGSMAHNANGEHVDVASDDAECFCLAGAILKASYNLDVIPYKIINLEEHEYIEEHVTSTTGKILRKNLPEAFTKKYPFIGFVAFNDRNETTYEEVINLVQKSINSLKETSKWQKEIPTA